MSGNDGQIDSARREAGRSGRRGGPRVGVSRVSREGESPQERVTATSQPIRPYRHTHVNTVAHLLREDRAELLPPELPHRSIDRSVVDSRRCRHVLNIHGVIWVSHR